MIKVSYTRYPGYQSITVTDHGPVEACSGVSWIMNAAGMGLANMAKTYPEAVTLEFNNFDERSDEIIVPDKRKKHARNRLR